MNVYCIFKDNLRNDFIEVTISPPPPIETNLSNKSGSSIYDDTATEFSVNRFSKETNFLVTNVDDTRQQVDAHSPSSPSSPSSSSSSSDSLSYVSLPDREETKTFNFGKNAPPSYDYNRETSNFCHYWIIDLYLSIYISM